MHKLLLFALWLIGTMADVESMPWVLCTLILHKIGFEITVLHLVPPSRLARVNEIGLSASLEHSLAEGTYSA